MRDKKTAFMLAMVLFFNSVLQMAPTAVLAANIDAGATEAETSLETSITGTTAEESEDATDAAADSSSEEEGSEPATSSAEIPTSEEATAEETTAEETTAEETTAEETTAEETTAADVTTPVSEASQEPTPAPEPSPRDAGVEYLVTFDSCGGSAVEPRRVSPGKPLGELPVPTLEDFVFVGWIFEEGREAFAETVINENVTLYAVWDIASYTYEPVNSYIPTIRARGGTPPVVRNGVHPTEPGQVMLFKVAEPVDGMVNTWDVTLRIEGRDNPVTSDIVLVIDTSGSMNANQRLTKAKQAATRFVDALLPSDLTRIGVVSFDYYAASEHQLSNNATSLKTAINALQANGGTFTQDGVREARNMLASSTADSKHIVLLSDGKPTYSYAIPNDATRRAGYVHSGSYYFTGTGYASTAYGTNKITDRVGNGTSLTQQVEWYNNTRAYYHHGNSAIAEAGFAKTEGTRVWTIALDNDLSPTDKQILQNMASPNSYYAASPEQLEAVFGVIAGEIGAAVKEAQIVDPMGLGFQVPFGEVGNMTATQGTPVYDSVNKRITWNPGTLTEPIGPGSDIRYAELTYRIELNDAILDLEPDGNGTYPTNGDARIQYIDAFGNSQSQQFPVPRVNPVLYTVTKELQDKDGNPITADRDFTVEILGPWGKNGEQGTRTFTLNPHGNAATRLLTDLRWASTYTFEETGTSVGALSDYDITYQVNGDEQTGAPGSFTIVDGNTEDVQIKVVNKEKPGSLTITKILDQSVVLAGKARGGTPVSFAFNVTGPNDYSAVFSLPDDTNSWTKTLDDLAMGDYTVTETTTGWTTSVKVDDGEPVSGNMANVTIGLGALDHTVIVTNKQTQNMSVTASKVWENALPDKPDIWFQLIRVAGDTEVEIGDPRKVVGDSVTWNQTDADVDSSLFVYYDPDGNPYTYKVQEVDEDGNDFIPAGYTKVEDGLTVTNTFMEIPDSDITSLRFEKTWAGLPEGMTPPVVTVRVLRNGQPYLSATLTHPNTVLEWKNLPLKDAGGNLFNYTIQELPINDFVEGTPVVTDSAIENVYREPSQSSTDWSLDDPAFVITRLTGQNKTFVIWTLSHVPQGDQVELLYNIIAAAGDNANKQPLKDLKTYLDQGGTSFIWLEGPNVSTDVLQDDPDSGEITVTVTFNPDGTVNSTYIHFQGENTWTHFAVGGYSTKLVEITNTYQPEVVSLIINKTWNDANNQDGLRPNGVVFNIYDADDLDTIVRSVTMTPDINGIWQPLMVENLPKYKNFTTLINYVVVELVPDGYTVTHTQTGNNWSFTNRHEVLKTYIPVMKAWEDNNNQDGLRPASVTVQLYANNTALEGKILVLNAANNWMGTFTDLPVNAAGVPIVYTVDEIPVPTGYVKTITQETEDGITEFTITNTHTPATVSRTVRKSWDDNDNQDGLRGNVTLKLVATVDGGEVPWATLKAASASGDQMDDDGLVTFTDKVNQSHKFEHLPEMYNGKPVVYTVAETDKPSIYSESYDQETLTVTNTYTPATTSKTVYKVWKDNNNQDGLRGDVTLKLVATVDGGEVAWATLKEASASGYLMDDDGLVTLTGKTDESHIFANLPENYQGKPVVYTVDEPTVPAGYTESYDQNTLTVTNTHTPAITSKTVYKVWKDNNNQDGLRGDVTLKLVATVDGGEVAWADLKEASASGDLMDEDGLVTLTGKTDESHIFANLPENYQGRTVVYTVDEPTVPAGYTESYDQNTLTVTNTHTPAITSKTVYKVWKDNNNQDGLRGDVTLKLVATVDGAEVAWADLKEASASGDQMDEDGLVTLTGKTDESHTFANLPENYQGKTAVYTVEETVKPSGYTASYDQETLTVTNTHTPATTSKTVYKVWVDNNNQDGLRGDVTLKLVATVDGGEVAWADLKEASASGDQMDEDGLVTLTGQTDESHTFANLPENYQGKTIVYTVDEPTVPAGYTDSYDQDTLTVTNTHTPATTSKTVYKAWNDNNNQDGLRGDVTLKLVATVDGGEVAWADLKEASATGDQMDEDGLVTLTGKTNESHTFANLPVNYQGKTVVYTVQEPTAPDHYTASYDQNTLTVTNTYTPDVTSRIVSKVWADNNNQDGLRGDVTLKLVATVDGGEVAWADLKEASASGDQMDEDGLVTLTGQTNESHTFANLPVNYQGKTVVYTVQETVMPEGYTDSCDQETLTVTNTYTPATTSKTVYKIWADNNDQDGLRGDVTLKLVATVGGAEVPWATLKEASASGDQMDDDGLVTLTGKTNESHTFANLPVNYQGQTVVYTVQETVKPEGYTDSCDQETLTVTNTHTPATTSKTVHKVWVDNNNQDGLRGDVTLKLVATVDGGEVAWADLKEASATGDQMDDDGLVTFTDKVNQSYKFENLPEKYNGKTVAYTVLETVKPSGYTASYDQETLTVTNTHTPATTSKTVYKVWNDNNNQDGLRGDVTLKLVATVDGGEVSWATLKEASASGDQMDDDGLVTLTGKTNESHIFANLPENYQGRTVVYTVDEPTVPAGYTETYDQNTLTVTNTHTPATTSKTVYKVWADNNNQDGLRGDVTLKLVATVNNVEVAWSDLKEASASGDQMDDNGLVTLTGKTNESHTFANLPVKYKGDVIVYTVLETMKPNGYNESYDQETLTVTNTHTPATTSKTVYKAWNDNNNQDGLRGDVTLKLVATVDGAEVLWATLKEASATGDQMDEDGLVTLTGQTNESHTFANLPEKYNGKTVEYTVLETVKPDVYTASYDQETLTVTNTHTPATTSKTVYKVWADNNDQDGLRGDVTLKLVATVDGAEVPWATLKEASASGDQMDDDGLVTLTGKTNESHTFANLPDKHQGKTVAYTVLETVKPSGYSESYDQETLTVTNTHTPVTKSVTVYKVWKDNNNQDGLRGDVTLKLVATVDGGEVAWADLKEASATGDQMDEDGLVTLTGKTDESHTFANLPVNYQGKPVVYTVDEPTVPAGYTETYDQNTLTVTNTHTPAITSKTVYKVWADNNNQDGLRGDVTLKLVATVDGAEVAWADLKEASATGDQMDEDGLVTLTGKINESHTFANLPENYQGKTVVYTVDEPTVPAGYTETYDQNTLTVTNTHTPAITSKTVYKVWKDNNNQDGLRGDVTLKLVATVDGGEVAWADLKEASATGDLMDEDGLVTLTGKTDESHIFANLPENYQGKPVVYTVDEPTVPAGYTESYDQETLTVTNTHTPAITSKTVYKVWKDNNNQDGLRGDVTLKLVATVDGGEVAWEDLKEASASGDQMDEDGLVTLTGKTNESHTFANLPVNYQGQTVEYTVDELTVPAGYTETYDQDTLTVTNTHTPATTSKTVYKVWADNNDQDGLRGDVTLKLVATVDGGEVAWADLKDASATGDQMDEDGLVTLTGQTDESHTFANLPVNYQGKTVEYTVEETVMPEGYTDSYDQETLTVTNTHTPATTSKTVYKVWADNNNQDGLRGDVTLKLVATVDGGEVAWEDLKEASASGAEMDEDDQVTLTGQTDESYTFANLPVNYMGDPIVYTVKELEVPEGYTDSYDQETLTVTNTHIPETTSLSVTKIWDDIDDGYDVRPADITVQLFADGEAVDGKTLILDGENNWEGMFTNLPKYAAGREIDYSVDETPVPTGYVRVITGTAAEGYTITNRLPMAEITKVADQKTFAEPGTVTYTYTVTNTSHVILTGVRVTDDKLGDVPLDKTTLAPGESATGTKTYYVTQADIDSGAAIKNVATVTADQEIPKTEDEEIITVTQNPGMTIEKTADKDKFFAAGEEITYTVVVQNTGNVTLEDVEVIDTLVVLTAEMLTESETADGKLEVGETWTYVYTYTVTPADVDAGVVKNVVTATNPDFPDDDPDNPPPTDEEEVFLSQFTIEKEAAEESFRKAGDIIHYTVMVKNTGCLPITDLVVVDSLVAFSSMILTESDEKNGVLDVDETWTLTYSYQVTEADVTAGRVLNKVTVTDPKDPNHPRTDEIVTPKSSDPTPPPPVPRTGRTSDQWSWWLGMLLLSVGAIFVTLRKRETIKPEE